MRRKKEKEDRRKEKRNAWTSRKKKIGKEVGEGGGDSREGENGERMEDLKILEEEKDEEGDEEKRTALKNLASLRLCESIKQVYSNTRSIPSVLTVFRNSLSQSSPSSCLHSSTTM